MKKKKLQCNGTGSKSYHRQHELLEKETKAKIFIENIPLMFDAVQFYAYQGRWDISKERVFDFHIYARGNLSPTVKEAKKGAQTYLRLH